MPSVCTTVSPLPGSSPSSLRARTCTAASAGVVGSTSGAVVAVSTAAREAVRTVTRQTVLGAGPGPDRGCQCGGACRADEVVEQHRPSGAVGQRQPPVGVLVVGAGLVDGAPVTRRVGEGDAQ